MNDDTRGSESTRGMSPCWSRLRGGRHVLCASRDGPARPAGAGPFPVVIYNQGARNGSERVERPFPEIAGFLRDAGYVALVTERRGFGRSDGPTLTQALADGDRQRKLIQRIRAEADGVLAAVEYLKTDASVGAVDDLSSVLPNAAVPRERSWAWAFHGCGDRCLGT